MNERRRLRRKLEKKKEEKFDFSVKEEKLILNPMYQKVKEVKNRKGTKFVEVEKRNVSVEDEE